MSKMVRGDPTFASSAVSPAKNAESKAQMNQFIFFPFQGFRTVRVSDSNRRYSQLLQILRRAASPPRLSLENVPSHYPSNIRSYLVWSQWKRRSIANSSLYSERNSRGEAGERSEMIWNGPTIRGVYWSVESASSGADASHVAVISL